MKRIISLNTALEVASSLAPEDGSPNDEYLRGMAELLAYCFPHATEDMSTNVENMILVIKRGQS